MKATTVFASAPLAFLPFLPSPGLVSPAVAVDSYPCRVVHMLSTLTNFWFASASWILGVVIDTFINVVASLSASVALSRFAIAFAVSC